MSRLCQLLEGPGIVNGLMRMKLAQTEEEKKQAFKLRFEIFNEELDEGIPENESIKMDIDYYDQFCDHLLLFHGSKLIGTYRFLPGENKPKEGFYSATEFDLSGLDLNPADCVEAGRACIVSEHRGQKSLMALLWGIQHYLELRDKRYLFGCASLPKISSHDAAKTFLELERDGKVDRSLGVSVLPDKLELGEADKGELILPPLLRIYLEFGSRVQCEPAFDPIFGCYDLFMLLDRTKLSHWGENLLKRFDERQRRGMLNGSSRA